MTTTSSHLSLASCCICAFITGFTFLLEGCGSGNPDVIDDKKCVFNAQEFKEKGESCKCKYNLDEFKESKESCFTAIEGAETCAGVEEKLKNCYDKAPRRGWQVHHPDYNKSLYGHCDLAWVDEIIDPKFPVAKKKFQETVEPCLTKLQIEHDCSPEYSQTRWKMYDGCWREAETAAGGKWEEKVGENGKTEIVTDCPTDWMWESVILTQKEWVDWYRANCKKN